MNVVDRPLSRNVVVWILLGAGIVVSWSCKPKDGGAQLPNIAPITRLANLPPPQDTIRTQNPRLTLYWVGDDPDGYVTGFRYRWSFRLNKQAPFQYKPYKYLLNIIVSGYALLVDTQDPQVIPGVYKYFATLPPEGLDIFRIDTLARGDTITINGIRVYASNSDSIRIPNRFPPVRVKNEFPVHVNPNGGTFIFDSQDTLNLHTFEVSAIDNLAAMSISPAEVSFETPQVAPPKTRVTGPTDTVLVLDHQTDTFPGIQFNFVAVDPNSRTIDYSWVVDKDQWPQGQIPWSTFDPSQTAYVTAANFPDPYASNHTFYVRARNEFGSIDTLGYFIDIIRDPTTNDSIGVDTIYARWPFHTVYPLFRRPDITYTQRILLINVSFDDTSGAHGHPTADSLDRYYTAMFNALGKQGKFDIARPHADAPRGDAMGFPSVASLSAYSMVFLYSDGVDFNQKDWHYLSGSREGILASYCFVGGKLIHSGWSMSGPLNSQQDFIWYAGVPHVLLGASLIGKYTGPAKGFQGYPDIDIDTTKLDTAWGGGLKNLWVTVPVGFGEYIHSYNYVDRFLGPVTSYVAVRYMGITFNTVWFGIPLYYMQDSQSLAALQKAMQDIGEY